MARRSWPGSARVRVRAERAGTDRLLPRRLASYQGAALLAMVETFPMTVTGKIQKYRLRQMAVELLGLQSAAEEKTA